MKELPRTRVISSKIKCPFSHLPKPSSRLAGEYRIGVHPKLWKRFADAYPLEPPRTSMPRVPFYTVPRIYPRLQTRERSIIWPYQVLAYIRTRESPIQKVPWSMSSWESTERLFQL
jgi:hypothetical protein